MIRIKTSIVGAAALTLLLAACVPAAEPTAGAERSRDPSPQVDPKEAAPRQPVQPVRSGDWTEWPREPGDWIYRDDERGSIALFGEPMQDAKLTVRCDAAARMIVISRAGVAPTGSKMVLRASQGMAELDAREVNGPMPYVAVGLPADAALLDQLAFSRGHFAVQLAGTKSIKVPAWPEMAHVIEDCRS